MKTTLNEPEHDVKSILKKVTIREIKEIEGYENLSDTDAEEIIQSLIALSFICVEICRK